MAGLPLFSSLKRKHNCFPSGVGGPRFDDKLGVENMEANRDHPKENEERLLTEFAVAAEPCVCRDSMANRGPGNKEGLQVCSELAWRVWSQAIQKRASFALRLGNIFILLGLELKLLLFSSDMSDSAIPWTTACQASLA